MRKLSLTLLLVCGVTASSAGQVRGLGFVQGKVVDEHGVPVSNVTFRALLPRVGDQLTGSTNDKGEWRVVGMAHGDWEITFEKPGYARARARVGLETELTRIPPLTVKLKPATP